MKATKISDDDKQLFHQATRLVKPLRQNNRQIHSSPKQQADPVLIEKRINAEGLNKPIPDQHAFIDYDNPYNANTKGSLNNDFYDELDSEYVQIGYGTDLIRDLKRGKWQAQASLDLHGYTLENALINLDRFISVCLDRNIRCASIIHGKGIGSPSGKPILKYAVRMQLSRLKAVQAWVQAKENEGGSGAVIILIRYKK